VNDKTKDWIPVVMALLDLATELIRHATADKPHEDQDARTQALIAKQMRAMDAIVAQIDAQQVQAKKDLAAAEASGRENAEFVETVVLGPDEEMPK
jgi:hypothetical protein